MSIEQERFAFEAWAASIGFCVTGKYAETIDVLCAESAFKAGYQAGRAALQLNDRDDAERYRWVKRHAHPNRGFDEWCLPCVDYVDDNLDAAIDEAIEKENSND
jgi:hypothetical protein